MLFLLLSIGCSLVTASVFKLASTRGFHIPTLLTANYAAATILSMILLHDKQAMTDLEPGLVMLGVVAGIVFIAGFFALAAATRLAGMSLSVGIMRVSVILPVLLSWLVWKELPSVTQAIGLGLAGMSFFGLAHQGTPRVFEYPRQSATSALALLFLMGGLADASLKVFSEVYARAFSMAWFMTLVFGVAGAAGAAWMAVVGDRIAADLKRRSWAWGIVLGGANLGSVAFMLEAVARIPGPVVFPLNNAGVMLGATLLGVTFWRERLTRPNRFGLALAVGAILLLSV